MEKKWILLIIILLIELIYIIGCVKAIKVLCIYLKKGNTIHRYLVITLILFLFSAITATVFQIINPQLPLSRIIITINLILEISYLYFLKQNYLISNNTKNIFSILLAICIIAIFKIGFYKWDTFSYTPIYILETLIAGTISLSFFIELNTKITTNIFENPIVYLMLGLFICFGLPFSFYSSMFIVHRIYPDFMDSLERKHKYIIIILSRISTICYIVFNFFITKAFRWK
jgi:hypothetical protein